MLSLPAHYPTLKLVLGTLPVLLAKSMSCLDYIRARRLNSNRHCKLQLLPTGLQTLSMNCFVSPVQGFKDRLNGNGKA